MKCIPILVACLVSGASLIQVARAQQGPRPFRLQSINFDMWCQETQHLPPTRCDQRLPSDDAAFQAYENQVENHEIEYLRRHAQERNIERNLWDFNPVDRPGTPTPRP